MATEKGNGQRLNTQVEADNAVLGQFNISDGLFLKVTEKGGSRYGNYILRMQHQGKRHDVSIGSRKTVKLVDAKRLAAKARIAILEGEDPKAAIGRKVVETTKIDFTLAAVVARCFETKKSSLKGDGEAGKWLSPLRVHILPKLGTVHVSEIDANAIVRVLKPIWQLKPEAAKKALNRLSASLETAELEHQGIIVDGAAARAKKLLGKQAHKTKHIPSTPYADLPDLYQRICDLSQTPSVLALRLCILTAQRLKPVRMARWDEFDLENAVWTIPAENMKGEKGKTEEYRCPLSPEAVRVIQLARRLTNRNELFPAQRGNGVTSDRGIEKTLDNLKEAGRPHGFRATFGDWAASHGVPHELAEKCLQHAFGSAVARAYRREDRLEDRRSVMSDWAQHATSAPDEALRANLRVLK